MLVGVFLAVTMERAACRRSRFAVGAYLPLSTTLPIFVGGAIKGLVDRGSGAGAAGGHERRLGPGSLFATGLVAGGTLTGTVVAFLHWGDKVGAFVDSLDAGERLTRLLGAADTRSSAWPASPLMGLLLYRIARRPFASENVPLSALTGRRQAGFQGFFSTRNPPSSRRSAAGTCAPSAALKSTWCSNTVRASWMRNLR